MTFAEKSAALDALKEQRDKIIAELLENKNPEDAQELRREALQYLEDNLCAAQQIRGVHCRG